jgi:AcrR family transcriptional regulator
MAKKPHIRSKRTRMSPAAREQQIVNGAIAFFADEGFSGTTRDLASRLGVVHGLIYRYFPDKDSLQERVYQEVFERAWDPAWLSPLKDRSRPIRDRLVEFYIKYAAATTTKYEWTRIFLLSGFAKLDITDRYRALIRRRIFPVVMAETRHALGLEATVDRGLTDSEHDLMYILHGGLLYIGVRRWVFDSPIRANDAPNVTRLVDVFLAGATALLGDSRHISTAEASSLP